MESIVYTQIPRIDPKLVDRARSIAVADFHEALGPVLGRQCLMQPQMRALFQKARICGPAITSYNFPGDNLMLHAAFRVAAAGDVLVITNGGSPQGAMWGEMATYYSRIRNLAGAVIDGSARDSRQVCEAGFPVFASCIAVSYPGKRGPGAVNVPVVVAGVTVNPGDLVVGDADGVIVIPPQEIEPAIMKAEARMAKEAAVKLKLDQGQTMFEAMDLKGAFKAAGVVEVEDTWKNNN